MNVVIRGNSIYYFTRIGVAFDGVQNVEFDNNIVGRILFRVVNEPRGGVLACTARKSKCSEMYLTNNIVAGATFGGFTTRGHNCGMEKT